ncbi:hypothetical protein DFQ28_006224 [Apophysomyces sp. BC1034]|nr:hypothetical protein DFQ28_006224 [Apophysomyces sp. BC1034]
MRELEQHLANSGDGRVVWTSSVTSDRSCFDLEDWQGINNPTPYESSKWACDLLAIASNQLFEKRKLPITSFTTSPGVASSGIGNFPLWVVQGRTPMHLLFRLFGVTSQNVSGYNAAGGDAAVTSQKLDDLDYHCRYSSMTDRWGTPYVEAHEVTGYDPIEAGILLRKCENAYRESKTDYRANAIKLV